MGSNRVGQGCKVNLVMSLSSHSVRCFCRDRDAGSILHSIVGKGQIHCAQTWGVFWLEVCMLGIAELEIHMDPLVDNQIYLVKMLGEWLLEVRVLCHDSALAIGDFDGIPSVLLKVGWDLEILHKSPLGSDGHKHLHMQTQVNEENLPAG